MKRRLFTVAILLVMALFALVQVGCTNPQDNSNAPANVATPEATPDTAAIEKELLRVENDWPRVMKERDGQAVRRVDADDAYLLGFDGSMATKEEDAKFIESGNLSTDSVEMGDLKVKVLDKDAAVVTGTITIKGGKIKAQNKILDVSGQYRFVDTFARQNSEWKLVASSSVKVLAPAAPTASPTPKALPTPAASPAAGVAPVPKPSPVVRPSPVRPLPRPTPVVRPSPVRVAPAPTPMNTRTPIPE